MCPRRFISCSRGATLVLDGDSWGQCVCVCVETDSMWELSELSAQFFHEPKTALKNQV